MFFIGQLARDMDVSVSFSNNQVHEARTREDRENLDVQMEKDSPWIEENSTEEWKQKRMRSLGKSQKLQKR